MLLSTCQVLRVSHSVCVLPTFARNFSSIRIQKLSKNIAMASDASPLVYRSLETILDDLNKPQHRDENGVKELLEIYDKTHDQAKKYDALVEKTAHPLVVLEGLDGSGKTTIGKRVAKKMHAEARRTPPNSIAHLRNLFDNHATLRTAYYCLGNYIAALEVQMILKEKPVVMDRYWHSTSAYSLAQAVHDFPDKYKMPARGDGIYQWPDDLFKPDMVLLLEVSEEVRVERHSRRNVSTAQEGLLKDNKQFRQNVLAAYKNMYDPGVETINSNYSFGSVLRQIDNKVQPLLH